MKLSDKIFIQEAIDRLELQKKPIDHVMHSLMKEKGLTTYFDINVSATESTGYEVRPISEDANESPYVKSPFHTQVMGPCKKICAAEVRENGVEVFEFEHAGKRYSYADLEGIYPNPVVLDFDAVYFDKSEFSSYQDLPAYQDKDHECYAPELDLAIQLHKAIYVDKCGNQSQSREDRIRSWLNTKYGQYDFSEAAITRLSAVIGGKPLKQKKK